MCCMRGAAANDGRCVNCDGERLNDGLLIDYENGRAGVIVRCRLGCCGRCKEVGNGRFVVVEDGAHIKIR